MSVIFKGKDGSTIEFSKFNPYHGRDGRFSSKGGVAAPSVSLPVLDQKQILSLQSYGISSFGRGDGDMDRAKRNAMKQFEAMRSGKAKNAVSVGVYETKGHLHTVAERKGANRKLIEVGARKIGDFDASGRFRRSN